MWRHNCRAERPRKPKGDVVSPRHNSKAPSRRRTSPRPANTEADPQPGLEGLARELVRRGLASKMILTQPRVPKP